jgi:signal transduction histidine kinase
VFESYLLTNVADSDEAFLTFVGDQPFLGSAGAPADITADADWLVANVGTADSRFDRAGTDAGDAVTLAVPLLVEGEVAGTFATAVWEGPGRDRVDRSVQIAAAVAAVALLGAAALAWGTAGRVLRPLRDLADTSRRITENDLSERIPPGGNDEVGELVDTFNDMLERLQRSFAAQRAFLDDAGHELRTPLTIVRGHVETSLDPEAWAASRPLVVSELDRMGRIVDDLLLLAKAEQPGFIHPHPVDLADLITATAERARSLGDRRVEIDTAPAVVIEADGQRLEQALVNLVANAVRHTAPGGLVAVGARVRGNGVDIWVRDDGEGIAAADHERIFARFATAEGRQRSGGAAGLGLSIVQAVAVGHGGTVTLDSEPGKGATFTLELPGVLVEDDPGVD